MMKKDIRQQDERNIKQILLPILQKILVLCLVFFGVFLENGGATAGMGGTIRV